MCKKSGGKNFFSVIIIIIALALAVFITVGHKENLGYILYVTRFFEVMLPILAAGALIKYLAFGHHQSCCCCGHSETCACPCHKEGETK